MKNKPTFLILSLLILGLFAIFPMGAYAAATVTFPNGGECLNGAGTYDITWTLTSNHTAIAYRTDGTTPPTWQGNGNAYFKHPTQGGATSFTWIVSDQETGTVSTARIWLDAHANGHSSEGQDSSNSDFSIDNSPPSAPVLSSPANTNTTIDLSWTASTDSGCEGLTGYKVFRDGAEIASGLTGTTYADSGLSAGTAYSYDIRAYDDFATTTSNALMVTTGSPGGGGGGSIGDFIFPEVISDLSVEVLSTTSVMLAWTATGDDGIVGTASSYDIRYSTLEITIDTWIYLEQVIGEPKPKVAGQKESFIISRLSPGTTYRFALNVMDDSGNESKFSNVVQATTMSPPDIIAPAAITDLAVKNVFSIFADLLWTTSGDDGNSGTAASYIIKYSTTSLSDANWLSAAPFGNALVPSVAGLTESTTITGLNSETTYYFAIKTLDEAGNESAISNVVIFRTLSVVEDEVAEEEAKPQEEKAASVFSESSLIRIVGSEKVYVIKNGKEIWIPTAEAFIEAGYDWSDIQEVSASGVAVTASGNLIQIEGEPEIYVITGGKRRHIPNAKAFVSEGYGWDDIVVVPKAHGAAYPVANLLRVARDPKVYVVERGLMRHIPNPESFVSYAYNWEDIIEVTARELAGYKNASLMRALDDFRVYLLEGNTKRWIKTAGEFNASGYDWNEVLDVSRTELDSYEVKEEVTKIETEKKDVAPSSVKLTVEGDEFSFSPKTVKVKRGDTVELTFKNVGVVLHNYIVDELNLSTRTIGAGETDVVTFTAPLAAGSITYTSYCSLPGHRESGMEGVIVIE